jgi:diguanylate cyclase (GGDEF)-like protein
MMAADGFVGGADVVHDPYRPIGNRGGSVFRAVRKLSELGRGGAGAGGRAAVQAQPATAAEPRPLGRKELLEALAALEPDVGAGLPEGVRLKSRLLDILAQRHGASTRLDAEDFDNLSVMETLVDTLESDRYLTDAARSWIRRLELTLNKLAATDRGFLERGPDERPHSAMTLLNQLARLGGDHRDGVDREIARRVDELLERVAREFDRNPEVIEDVVDELDPLVDKQARTYRSNLERTVRASEGRQKLVRARRTVLAAMTERLAGREIPELLLQLVNPGWRNLLVHTHLRRGIDSPEWHDQLDIFDKLHGLLDRVIERGSPDYVEPEALLKRVVQGLNSISFDPARRTPLVMALSATLVGDVAGEREPVRYRHVPDDGVAEALGLEGIETVEEPEPTSDAEEVRRNWTAALARARRIEVGEWLATTDPSGRPLILAVAFLGDDFGSFVLVNRKGVKIRECTLAEMTEDLCLGRITLLDDFDLPLMERASQRMLENMHSQLAFQASHDELTTLLNRREFERLVARSVQMARTREEIHALLYIDLDQFKIINNTSGHTAGDELLKRIAAWLSSRFAGERVHLARLGGDEFGMLAEALTREQARELAERVLEVIREHVFEWEGRSYTLSATIGLVLIDHGTESVDHAMQCADEACYAAKDAGRNRVQEYRSADTVIQARHGIMESVTQLDRALAEDRLILNCQRVAPVLAGSGLQTHYEILLSMADGAGQVIPPAEFILAAETYQRMAAVDRWVIRQVLRWMADNRDRLERFGGFAVNVSGDSMNDETFPDFVLQQFELTGAPTGKVCFEITETAAITNLENAREFMNRMKIIGCSFALDDFGTGLSSYSYLRNLPVDYVKIDGVFIKGLAESQDDYAVVRSINEIGHYLGKETIAECVESLAILDRIGEIGVDFAQGYYIGKPVRLDELQL